MHIFDIDEMTVFNFWFAYLNQIAIGIEEREVIEKMIKNKNVSKNLLNYLIALGLHKITDMSWLEKEAKENNI